MVDGRDTHIQARVLILSLSPPPPLHRNIAWHQAALKSDIMKRPGERTREREKGKNESDAPRMDERAGHTLGQPSQQRSSPASPQRAHTSSFAPGDIVGRWASRTTGKEGRRERFSEPRQSEAR